MSLPGSVFTPQLAVGATASLVSILAGKCVMLRLWSLSESPRSGLGGNASNGYHTLQYSADFCAIDAGQVHRLSVGLEKGTSNQAIAKEKIIKKAF